MNDSEFGETLVGLHCEAKFDKKFLELFKQLNLYLNNFPGHEKFGLAQQIRNTAYEAYGYVIESQKRYQKKTSLTNLDIKHEQLRMYIRLAHELNYFENKQSSKSGEERFRILSLMVDEIGKMIGGWINSVNSTK